MEMKTRLGHWLAAAGLLAAGCDVINPPFLASGYPETVVVRTRHAGGPERDFLWTAVPGEKLGLPGPKRVFVYERIEVQDLEARTLQVVEGEALEEASRAAATNSAFTALLLEPSGARWLSKKEFRDWMEQGRGDGGH